jgi:hypothetical protein
MFFSASLFLHDFFRTLLAVAALRAEQHQQQRLFFRQRFLCVKRGAVAKQDAE